MDCHVSVRILAILALLWIGSVGTAQAQYLPYGYYPGYGWGGYPGAEHDANMRETTRQIQSNLQATTARTTEVRQQYNRGLVDNARRNSAWIEEQNKSVAEWRLRTTQPTARPASRPPAAYAPPAAAPVAPQGVAPAPLRDLSKLVIKWPTILKDARFEGPRTRLEKLAAEKKPLKNGLSSSDYQLFADQIAQMQATLKQIAPELNAAEYQVVDQFLASLLRELQGALKAPPQ